jgi:glycosyltransferase involved in cell wall biosynthesis
MRILFFNRSAMPMGGGMNRLVIDTIRRLRAAGHEVALVHARGAGQLEGTGYIYDDLDQRLLPRDRNALRLEAILEDFAPDVIQLHGVGNTLLDGWLAARKPTVRFVHNHTFYCSGRRLTLERPCAPCTRAHGRGCAAAHWVRGCGSMNPAINFVRYRYVARSLTALRSLHGLQVMSPAVRRQLLANGVPEERITMLPPYAPPPPESRHGPMSSLRTILHVGGLLGQKGVWMVVRMVRELPRDVQLVFAGGGEERELLEAHVRRRALGSRVRIVGEPTPEQWSLLYRESDLVVMPVRWNEPLGLEGLGAMAHGKPVVAFETEGIRQWLSDGETGLMVPFGDRRGFRDAVQKLLAEPERLRGLGRRAREIWSVNFRPERHIAALLAHYEKLKAEVPA